MIISWAKVPRLLAGLTQVRQMAVAPKMLAGSLRRTVLLGLN